MAKTYEEILDEMCKRVKECSTMEGSFIYTALASFAMELTLLYLQLEEDENRTFYLFNSREDCEKGGKKPSCKL